jgi:heme A synthase
MSPDSNFSLSNLSRFAKFAWFVLAYNILVILWGAFVRASKSGDGCGSHWPLCNGEVVPLEATTKTLIEFTHRVTSGIDGPLVLGLVIWAFLISSKSSSVRRFAVLSFIMVLFEAAIGMFLVKFEFVADNVSTNRAILMSIHLVSTLILLFFMTMTAWYASGGKAIIWRGNERRATLIGVGLFLVGLVGMSGAVSALGNTLFPGRELAEAFVQPDVSLLVKTFVWLQLWHPFLSVLTSIYLIALAQPLRSAKNNEWTRRFANLTLLLIGTQMVCGVLNMFLHAPIWMQLVHLLLADFMWIALVLMSVSALSQNKLR